MASANNTPTGGIASAESPANYRPLMNDRTYVEDWRDYYPSGIPHNYLVVHESGGRYPEYYHEIYVTAEYYTNPPSEKEALFSTEYGKLPARAVVDPVEDRCMKLWSASVIQETCNSIRKKHWAQIRDLKAPVDVLDLFRFFDAHDIYYQGFLNLWNVAHQLVLENGSLANDPTMTAHYEIGLWADNWLDKDTNKMKLVAFQGADIIDVLSAAEQEEIPKLEDQSLTVARHALAHRLDMLRRNTWATSRAFPETSLQTHWMRGQVYLWLAGQAPFTGRSCLPSPYAPRYSVGGGSQPDQAPTNTTPAVLKPEQQPLGTPIVSQSVIAPQAASSRPSATHHQYGAAHVSMAPARATVGRGASAVVSSASFSGSYSPAQSGFPPTLPAATANMSYQSPMMYTNNSVGGRPYTTSHGHVPYGRSFPTPAMTVAPMLSQRNVTVSDSLPKKLPTPPHLAKSREQNVPKKTEPKSSKPKSTEHKKTETKTNSKSEPKDSGREYKTGGPKAEPSPMDVAERQSAVRRNSLLPPRPHEGFPSGPPRNFTEISQNAPVDQTGSSGDSAVGWQYQKTNDLHGPTWRRSPPAKHQQSQRQRGFSRSSNGGCANYTHPSQPRNKFSYFDCDCNFCQRRNSSVFVSLTSPAKTHDINVFLVAMAELVQDYANVIDIRLLYDREGNEITKFLLQLENVTQAKCVSMVEETFLPKLGTTVRMSAPYNSCYGHD